MIRTARRALRAGLALTFAGALCACAAYHPLPLPQTPTLLAGGEAPFPDGPLTAAQIDVLVLQRDVDLKAVRRQKGVASAQLLQAGLLPDPTFGGAVLPLVAGVGTTFAWNATLQEDLRSIFTLSLRKRGARDAAHQVDAQLLWQEWVAVGQARLLYADLVAGEEALRILNQSEQALADRTARLQRALAQGNTTLITFAPDLAALQAARAQVDTLERRLLGQRHQLNAMLDREPDAPLQLAGGQAAPEPDVDAIFVSAAQIARRRPDLIALRLGYRAQEARTRLAILDQFPVFNFGLGGGSDNANVRNLGPQFSTTLPVFDRNRGDVALQRATRAQMHAEYQARLDGAYSQARAAVAELRQAEAQLQHVQGDLAATRSAAAKAKTAFQAGALDELGYVDLISANLTKEEEVVTLQQAVREQEVALATLTGAGLPSVDTLPDAAP